MTVTYGFYNSQNHDRKYNASQISDLFKGIIKDGVFSTIGSSLIVQASSGMTVNVGTGRAWFDNTWTNNDAVLPLTLDPSDVTLNRIDAIVLEVGDSSDVRANTIKIVKGTPASSPSSPAMINVDGQHQHPLCYIYVSANVSAITQANITNKVGTIDCPFITGAITTVTTDTLVAQWESEFDAWFNNLQSQMAGDVATNLQNQINTLWDNNVYTVYSETGTGAANAITVSEPKITNLYTKLKVSLKIAIDNTGATTLKINSLAAVNIKYYDEDGTLRSLASGDLQAGDIVDLEYDGTQFIIIGRNQSSSINMVYPVTGSGTNTITGTNPDIVALKTGLQIALKCGGTNNGPTTLNINSLGAKYIMYYGADGALRHLSLKDLVYNNFALLYYDGTQFILQNVINTDDERFGFFAIDRGVDGTVVISSNTTWTDNIHCFWDLTINAGCTLTIPSGSIIMVEGTLNIAGSIVVQNGSAGGSAGGGGGIGGGGGGSIYIFAKTVTGGGSIIANGGAGANVSGTPVSGTNPGGQGGTGIYNGVSIGAGVSNNGAAGTVIPANITKWFKNLISKIVDQAGCAAGGGGSASDRETSYNLRSGGGGAGFYGNGGAGINATGSGGYCLGGAGGGGGGLIFIMAVTIIYNLTLAANGGKGGDSGSIALASSGGGGGGGLIVLVSKATTGLTTSVAGGVKGTASGTTASYQGTDGSAGLVKTITI